MRNLRDLYNQAQQMNASDPDGAIRHLKSACDAGDLEAMYQLAVILEKREPMEAIRLFKELDAADIDSAACYVGRLYCEIDPELAKHWFERAIARKDFASNTAMLNLGRLLLGSGEAIEWLERSLASGEGGADAALSLAVAIVDRDTKRSLELLNFCVRHGKKRAYLGAALDLKKSGNDSAALKILQGGTDAGDWWALEGLYKLTPWSRPAKKVRYLLRALWRWKEQYKTLHEEDPQTFPPIPRLGIGQD